MKNMIEKISARVISAIALAAVLFAFPAEAGCYKTKTYTCHSAQSGCLPSGCTLCSCVSPSGLGGPKCWYDDTKGSIVRVQAGNYGNGYDDIRYNDVMCTYSHTTWNCFGTSTTTTVNEPIMASVATGSSC